MYKELSLNTWNSKWNYLHATTALILQVASATYLVSKFCYRKKRVQCKLEIMAFMWNYSVFFLWIIAQFMSRIKISFVNNGLIKTLIIFFIFKCHQINIGARTYNVIFLTRCLWSCKKIAELAFLYFLFYLFTQLTRYVITFLLRQLFFYFFVRFFFFVTLVFRCFWFLL